MKKKIIIICVFVVLFLIGGIWVFKYNQLKNDEFIKYYKLQDDVLFMLNTSDISKSPNSVFFTDAVSFQLKRKYSLMMKVKVNDNIIYTKKLGFISGKGKYYYRFSNDGKTIQFSDYLITLNKTCKSTSYTKWFDIPYEVDEIGRYQSVGADFNKNTKKSLIGGVTWEKNRNDDDRTVVNVYIYAI